MPIPWHRFPVFALAFAALAAAGCRPASMEPTTPSIQAQVPTMPYRARGNEPFWSIEVRGDALHWNTPDTSAPVVWSSRSRSERADGFDAVATRNGATLALSATHVLCRDSMSGMPYPHTVTVRVDGHEVRGCGGEARELLDGRQWTVSSIDARPTTDAMPTLAFLDDGSASGFAGCNRWTSPLRLTGEGLSFENVASTMMACPEAAMRLEQAFLDAISKVSRHDFDAAGNLLLKAGDTTLIIARRNPQDAAAATLREPPP